MNKHEISELGRMLLSDQEDVVNLGISVVENIPMLEQGGMPMDVLNALSATRTTLLEAYCNADGSPEAPYSIRSWPEWRRMLMHTLHNLIVKGYGWDAND